MMKNKTYKAFTQNPQFACPYAIRDLIKGLDSKDTSESSLVGFGHCVCFGSFSSYLIFSCILATYDMNYQIPKLLITIVENLGLTNNNSLCVQVGH
jgi:hypothetical protein